MAYATLSQLRKYLGISEAEDDSLLTDLIARAQKTVETETGLVFEAVTATRYYDPTVDVSPFNGYTTLVLDYPLLTVTTLTNGDSTVITSSQYALFPANETVKWQIRLKGSSGLMWTYIDDPEQAISVAGTWGYSITAPADIQQATLRLAGYLYRQRDAQVFDVVASPGQGIITIPQGIPRDVERTLNRYRNRL